MVSHSRPQPQPAPPVLSIADDAQALMQAAAQRVVTLGEQAMRLHGRFTWALAGGSTPRQLYALLGTRFATTLDWSRVDFFWGDERCVPPDDPDSNYRMARETLLDAVHPDSAHVHRMQGEAEPTSAAVAYEQLLHAFFEVPAGGAPPSFDLVLLGMGADGHTASLFPGTAALDETQRWVVVNRPAPSAPPRLSLTLPILNAASHVLFLVSGASKAASLEQVLVRSPAGDPLPARRVRPHHGQLEWMVDAEAAAQLEATT